MGPADGDRRGFDYYVSDYDSARPSAFHAPRRSINTTWSKRSHGALLAADRVKLPTNTEIVRWHTRPAHLDPGATTCSIRWRRVRPGRPAFRRSAASAIAGIPLDQSETNHAYHVGIEQRLIREFCGVRAHGAKLPRAECRRAGRHGHGLNGMPTTFDLRTQKSHDWEAGVQVRQQTGSQAQWSYYDMKLDRRDHVPYRPNFEARNNNLDPTRRYGDETIVTMKLSRRCAAEGWPRLYRAMFREGQLRGQRGAAGVAPGPAMSACPGTSSNITDARWGGALCRRAADGQRSGQSPAT